MAGKRRKKRAVSAFGSAVAEHLVQNQMTPSDLANALGVDRSYTSRILSGEKHPSAEWADLVARTLKLQEAERIRLHRAAAVDAGYQIDLDLSVK